MNGSWSALLTVGGHRRTRRASALAILVLAAAGCDAESTSMVPDVDEMVLSPGTDQVDAGRVNFSGDAGGLDLPPGQRYQVGGGIGVGTVAGGVLMTSERYKLFGATGQSPANLIKATTERFYLRSGVVGVTP